MLPQSAFITKIEQDNYRTKTFVLDMTLDGYPGQFAMVWLPRFDEKPYSLVSTDPVTFMVTAVGPFSRLVHGLAVGDQLWLRGPFGQGFQVPAPQKRLALIGGGYGVAPLYWLARTQIGHAATLDVIVGARSAADILYVERFQQLAEAARGTTTVQLHITTEDGSAGTQGIVTATLELLLTQGAIDGIYACGPHGMLTALQQLGERFQIPTQLSWEAYMRCGIGICGACDHEGKVLCLDGPVLRR
jgi:dihydroorotate dehydrogenase electron transfer subunit